ncbi:kinase-like domain-containing protein [Aspergillus pseudoustus]|uniref:non-specific serine/threonine protein kinase n=1 Tax=Aspergillus pseudoustus TaxID=1810923 RepID=A0ABR4IZG7_9EURO
MQFLATASNFLAPIDEWQYGVEDLEFYRSGGYHPSHIGDCHHNNRYEIVHKLDFGGYSTVWIARDRLTAKNVALKITLVIKDGTFVASLLDEFTIDGPNGRHLCIVTVLAGCSVWRLRDASLVWKFPLNVARAMAAQSLLGLAYIHSCGIVHGDLHVNNILFKFSNLENASVEELCAELGEPHKIPVKRLDKVDVCHNAGGKKWDKRVIIPRSCALTRNRSGCG